MTDLDPSQFDLMDTPVVTIDLDIMDHNIRRYQEQCDRAGVGFRPHIKTHKIPALAMRQLEAGAIGITCQTVGEVEVMLQAGVKDIMLTYNIIGAAKLERLRRVASACDLKTVCDNATVADALSSAFAGGPVTLKVLVECDTGLGRNGVQSPGEAAELAAYIDRLPGIAFAGLMTYPITPATSAFLSEAYRELETKGLKAEIVSTGGTPTISLLAEVPGVTEHRAGTYIFGDRMCVSAGVATWDECAMRIRATVVSRPTKNRAIIDAGSKTISSDVFNFTDYGHIVEYPDAAITQLSEEHGTVRLPEDSPGPEVGEIVTIIPNHTCVVTNLHDDLVGVRGGKVEEIWEVAARGLVR